MSNGGGGGSGGYKGFRDCRTQAYIRAVGARKWSDPGVGLMEFIHYFSDLGLQTTHFRFIYARMCIFASKCV